MLIGAGITHDGAAIEHGVRWKGGLEVRAGSKPGQNLQLVTSLRHALQACNLHRLPWQGLADGLASSSAQGAQLAPVAAHHHKLPHLEAAALHYSSGHRALPLVQLGFHHHCLCVTAGAGLQV